MRRLHLGLYLTFAGLSAQLNAETACFKVTGMTCFTCSLTLKSAVRKLQGIQSIDASVADKSATVGFDPSQTNPEAIRVQMNTTGYEATIQTCEKGSGK